MQITDNRDQVISESRKALTPEIVRFIEECRLQPHAESQVIAVLHRVQEHFGYLDSVHLDAVAQLLQVPAAKVAGVATFYHFFRLEPRGRFIIRICLGTACYVKGADRLIVKLQEELGIGIGETSKDGIFSLEASRCLGTCGLAPVLMIGEDVHAQVTPDRIPAILEQYLAIAHQQEVISTD